MKLKLFCLAVMITAAAQESFAQEKHHFIDGYHGGVYGHYPEKYTEFINSRMQANPHWKINLEIEPETWDCVKVREPGAYAIFKKLFADQSDKGRIEVVSPAYGQSYLYTGSGESMIRQFSYGIQKMREHFPEALFTTYSSEEPCFTSAMPQVLLSFGYKYASLKNPNTCWGGYTRAFGGELVTWEGPDGSKLLTVPRYASEALLKNSTWQTTAWDNSREYIQSAYAMGIKNPIGMCLQDAGWRNGPWLKDKVKYETWRNYIGNIADKQNITNWKFSQEDVLVSLVWGSQALQQIAQQVRRGENKIAMAEKYAAMRVLHDGAKWPQRAIDTAWKSLLLAQHHDCWIVPYNGKKGDTWIDKTQHWTDNTIAASDSIMQQHGSSENYFRVLNSAAFAREEWVTLPKPERSMKVLDNKGKPVMMYVQADGTIAFKAKVPAAGFSVYSFQEASNEKSVTSPQMKNGKYFVETDLYQMEIDPAKGGVITSLIAKTMKGRQMVDPAAQYGFNEIRGFFYDENAWRSSMDSAAAVTIVENNPARVVVEIKGAVGGQPFTQQITLTNGQRRIDMQVKVDWNGSPGIGAYSQQEGYRAEDYKKAFYDDRFKLQVLFPVNLKDQQLTKDAPFDVTESRLDNTFFNSWDSIKHNVILHWADVSDKKAGMALFTDHTTSYVHGKDYPLGFTLQYIGRALWGRNYYVDRPTLVNYAIMPHEGTWDAGGVSQEETKWCEPLTVIPATAGNDFSLLSLQDKSWQIPAMYMDGDDLIVRLYNASGDSRTREVSFNGKLSTAVLEQLNGDKLQPLSIKYKKGKSTIRLSMPRFGIRTIRLTKLSDNTL